MRLSLGSPRRNGAVIQPIGAVSAPASATSGGTAMPFGTKRTPCWASTRPARLRRSRLTSAPAIAGRVPRAERDGPAGTLPRTSPGSSEDVRRPQRRNFRTALVFQPYRHPMEVCDDTSEMGLFLFAGLRRHHLRAGRCAPCRAPQQDRLAPGAILRRAEHLRRLGAVRLPRVRRLVFSACARDQLAARAPPHDLGSGCVPLHRGDAGRVLDLDLPNQRRHQQVDHDPRELGGAASAMGVRARGQRGADLHRHCCAEPVRALVGHAPAGRARARRPAGRCARNPPALRCASPNGSRRCRP